MNFVRRRWKRILISIGALVFFFNFPDMIFPIVASYFSIVFFTLMIGTLDITDEGKKHLIYILFGIFIVINLCVFFLDWDVF